MFFVTKGPTHLIARIQFVWCCTSLIRAFTDITVLWCYKQIVYDKNYHGNIDTSEPDKPGEYG